jgi:peptidoglycan hydrolase-like protein with peptidoglycan-binding domain
MVLPFGLALAVSGCGQTDLQRGSTGAATGALAGAAVAGPVGALVGGGAGAAAGVYREQADDLVDQSAETIDEAVPATGIGSGGAEASQRGEQTRSAARSGRPAEAAGPPLTNADVRDAQQALADLGLYTGRIDGLYGPRTIAAVQEFQRQQGMQSDGTLDADTMANLRQSAQAGGGASPPSGQPQPRAQQAPGQQGGLQQGGTQQGQASAPPPPQPQFQPQASQQPQAQPPQQQPTQPQTGSGGTSAPQTGTGAGTGGGTTQ